MANLEITPSDSEAIRQVLVAERAAGNPNPLLPADVDIDGDGICDAFGLDDNDQVIVVSGAHLSDTLYHSEGDDIGEQG